MQRPVVRRLSLAFPPHFSNIHDDFHTGIIYYGQHGGGGLLEDLGERGPATVQILRVSKQFPHFVSAHNFDEYVNRFS